MSDMISGDEACYYPVTDCVLAYEVRRLTAALAERDAMLAEAREALEIIGDGYVQPKDAPLLHNEAVDTARAALASIDALKGAPDA